MILQYRFKYHSVREMYTKVITVLITLVFFTLYVMLYQYADRELIINYQTFKYNLSFTGLILGIFIMISWYQLTNKIFSLYTIFILFLFLFNYGHGLLWALGIHSEVEIGQTPLFTLGLTSPTDIIKTQLIILISILAFHCGAVLYVKPMNKHLMNNSTLSVLQDDKSLNSIYDVSFVLSLIVVPITFYNSIYNLKVASSYGYSSLYYGEHANSGISIFILISMMFFPCLVGLLIGSRYRGNVKIAVYIIFSIYVLLGVMTGDRGEWLYKLLILFWMSHTFNQKFKLRSVIKYILLGIGFLYLVSAIVSMRNTGITLDGLKDSLSSDNNVIVSSIFEMGQSMRPTIVLVKSGWGIFPYGNSYIFAILGIVSERFISILNIPYVTLSSWFSQDYLGISYGAGFSVITEALLNFGPYGAPLFLCILGYITTSVIHIDTLNYKSKPLRVFFAVTTTSAFIAVVRNTMQTTLKGWFYTTLIIYILILIYRSLKYANKK